MMLVFTSINAQYYYIGSTIDEVISIEGEPNSVMQLLGSTKTLSFDNGSVTFTNGKVESYTNRYGAKLKVKYKKESSSTSSKKVVTSKKIKNKRYVYFTYVGSAKDTWNEWTQKYDEGIDSYSNLYIYDDYTEGSELYLKSCLLKQYKRWNGGKYVFLKVHVYEDSDFALQMWNTEIGKLSECSSCTSPNMRGLYKWI